MRDGLAFRCFQKSSKPTKSPNAIGPMAMPSSRLRDSGCRLYLLCLHSYFFCCRAAELLRCGIDLLDAGTLGSQSRSSNKKTGGPRLLRADVLPSSRTIFASPAYGASIRLPTKPSQLPTMIAFLLISLPMA